MQSIIRAVALAALLVVSPGGGPTGPAYSAHSIDGLSGRWSGWGSVTMDSGAAEQVKCVATYFVKQAGFIKQDGAELVQNLRCASQSFRIDAVANLDVKGDQVSGKWEERTYAAHGSVSGRLTSTGFNLSIQGDNFSAAMLVSMSDCKQSITIAPRGFDIARIAVGLDKC
ncbi:MAG: hypothetical protein ABL908_10515 [Hyphomicrobium sp.]